MARPQPLKDSESERRIFTIRAILAAICVFALVGVLIARYYTLQILDYETYRTISESNRVHLQHIAPKRGLISDANGVLLAENQPTHTLTIVKERVGDLDATLKLLSQLLHINPDDLAHFHERLRRFRAFEPAPLMFNLSEDDIATIAVNRYRLPGVEVVGELTRNYPLKELFAHSVGYVGRISEQDLKTLDADDYSASFHIGKTGVERVYEDELHGTVGYENVETNARGRVLRVLERHDPIPGQDIVLYADANVQRVAQEALGEERGAVVALDTRTGGIIALASTPSFDPNLFVNGISFKDYSALRDSIDVPLYNRALQGQYPPGSTVKPMFALAGLEGGYVTASSTVYDPGFYRLPGDTRKYRCWRRGGHGAVDVRRAIMESCDIYYYDLAHRMGIDRVHAFATQFGFGEKTGVDLTSERPGVMPSTAWKRQVRKERWYQGETLSVGIGQGYMLATPLQLAYSMTVLANRGKRYLPRIVRSVGGRELPPHRLPDIELKNAGNWDIVVEAMKDVVHSPRGTAKGIAKDIKYTVAGKTGTAQVVGYAQNVIYNVNLVKKRQRDHALFVAFAPVEDPQIAVAVMVENGEHGSTTAAPIARKVFDAYLLPRIEAAQPQAADQATALPAPERE
jgi:penicillin-binding protein 2